MTLSQDEKKLLLHFARQGLKAAAHGYPLPEIDFSALPPTLQQPGASFVTLTKRQKLRGCIGTLIAEHPLAEDVLQHGMDAAFDYRFAPVQPDELDQIRIEVSVLTVPEPLLYNKTTLLLEKLQAGVDGVVVQSGRHKATFLPQVWEKVSGKKQFMDMLCQKASLPPDAWREQHLDISTYRVISFGE
ncbi:MAG: AmmeMemoRadiSam system protein A [Anaerolineales bacterium]|nr:AmmeMemoRadiSam system protein A [Anaerolineales bacterium]